MNRQEFLIRLHDALRDRLENEAFEVIESDNLFCMKFRPKLQWTLQDEFFSITSLAEYVTVRYDDPDLPEGREESSSKHIIHIEEKKWQHVYEPENGIFSHREALRCAEEVIEHYRWRVKSVGRLDPVVIEKRVKAIEAMYVLAKWVGRWDPYTLSVLLSRYDHRVKRLVLKMGDAAGRREEILRVMKNIEAREALL